MKNQVIKAYSSATSAEQVLIKNGFKVVSCWVESNRFTKNGKTFQLSHPVWQLNEKKTSFIGVRIEEVVNA